MRTKMAVGTLLAVGLTFCIASPALAQEVEPTNDMLKEAGGFTDAVMSNLWVFLAGVLVFLMQAGFAFLEAGLTRAKNIANIMAKNLADMAIGVTAFFIVGWTIAYGADGSDWIGGFGDLFFMDSADPSQLNLIAGFDDDGAITGVLSPATNFFFQVVFAATAVTIASGAMAERTKFVSYLVFSAVMTALIYPIVVHWTWGGGLIAQIEIGDAVYSDFAGSAIVHMTGGIAAFIGAMLLGPRIGKYDENGKPRAIPGHNMGFAVIGVFILWFGWFGFNAGSELAADELVPFIALNTLLAAAAGVIGSTIVIWLKSGVPDVAMAANGALAGLVSITAPVGTVEPWAALVIGFLGGMLVVFAVLAIDNMGIDDPVGAVAVHGVCGIWGTLSIGLFARYDDAFLGREDAGLFYGGGVEQLAVQALMVLIIAAWVAVASFIAFSAIKATIGLRVSEEEEMEGLDIREHGGHGYGLESASIA